MQTIQSSSRFCRYAHFFSMAIAGLAVLAGGTALFGWMLGLGRLIRLGLSADAPIFAVAADAAVAMLLAGLVLLLHQDAASGRLRRRTASACALGVVVFGGLAATDILFSAGFGLGGLFATDAFGETASMSLGEALALVLLGSASGCATGRSAVSGPATGWPSPPVLSPCRCCWHSAVARNGTEPRTHW